MKYFKIIVILLLISTKIHAEKMRLAIMDLEPKNVNKDTAETVSDLLRTELFNTGLFDVIERGEMKTILKEQDFQLSGCTETECAVQMGKLLSARKILVGTVSKLGTKFIINARIVDVELGKMEFGDKASSKSEEELEEAVSVFAQKLASRIKGETVPEHTPELTTKSSKPSQKRTSSSLQEYVYPLRTSGIISLIVGTACGIGGYYYNSQADESWNESNTLHEEYLNATSNFDAKWDTYNTRYEDSQTEALIGKILYISAGATLSYGIIATFFIRKPVKNNISIQIYPNQTKIVYKF